MKKKQTPGCRYIYRINNSVGCLHHGFSVEKICRANWFATAVTVEGCLLYLWQVYLQVGPQMKSVPTRESGGNCGTCSVAVRGWVTATSRHSQTARASTWDYLTLHWEYPTLVEFKIILSVCGCVCVCTWVCACCLSPDLVKLRTAIFFQLAFASLFVWIGLKVTDVRHCFMLCSVSTLICRHFLKVDLKTKFLSAESSRQRPRSWYLNILNLI